MAAVGVYGVRYALMSNAINLADPAVEPTDEDLCRLSREAFADVAVRHRETLVRLRERVASLRIDALAHAAALRAQALRSAP